MLLKLNHVIQLIFGNNINNNNKHDSVATLDLNIHRPVYINTRFINHAIDMILEIILLFAHISNLHTGVVCCVEFE